MDKGYRQLTLKERKEIEDGLNRGDSFRAIARLIGRSPSTVSREVRENRHVRAFRPRKGACRDRSWCKRVGVCAECVREGAFCAGCDVRDCRDFCPAYAERTACDALTRAPWVCNGCRKNRYGCNRGNRFAYEAQVAQRASDERRSDSRRGIDMEPGRAEAALAHIKDGIGRGLSPYEISVLYEDVVGVHRSTIYRWVDAGYGGLTNLELERKVDSGPEEEGAPQTHLPLAQAQPRRVPEAAGGAQGFAHRARLRHRAQLDVRAVMTLYNLPSHLQLALLLEEHDCANVKKGLAAVKDAMPEDMHARWMRTVLTDNGEEFADEDGIGALAGERIEDGKLGVRLYYCDPRQSQQKGGCEKNHTEIRQILEKGMFAFDELTGADMAVLMSHANSNPRASLGGKTPIQMLRFVYGEAEADALLDALGIQEVGRDELMLKPECSTSSGRGGASRP